MTCISSTLIEEDTINILVQVDITNKFSAVLINLNGSVTDVRSLGIIFLPVNIKKKNSLLELCWFPMCTAVANFLIFNLSPKKVHMTLQILSAVQSDAAS